MYLLLLNGTEKPVSEADAAKLLGVNTPITLAEIRDGFGFVTTEGVLVYGSRLCLPDPDPSQIEMWRLW